MAKRAKSHEDPLRTTPLGTLRYSIEAYASAHIVDEHLSDESLISLSPVYAFIGRAIELALKAYLIQVGVALPEIRSGKFGHNLISCLKEAEKRGLKLKLSANDRELVKLLNDNYSSKQFEYIETGAKTFPIFGSLEKIANRIIRTVATAVPNSKPLLRSKCGRIVMGLIDVDDD
jgi:hypothetical protein